MREQLGVLVVEEADGKVAVQLFERPDKAKESFDQLKGKPGDSPSRATFISLDFEGRKADVESRDLPVEEDRENAPDGYKLGEGPIWFDKEKK
jgi:hypothetical protein